MLNPYSVHQLRYYTAMEDDYLFGTRRFILLRGGTILDFHTREVLRSYDGRWIVPEAKHEYYRWNPVEETTTFPDSPFRRFTVCDSGTVLDRDTREILRNRKGTWFNEEARKQFEIVVYRMHSEMAEALGECHWDPK